MYFLGRDPSTNQSKNSSARWRPEHEGVIARFASIGTTQVVVTSRGGPLDEPDLAGLSHDRIAAVEHRRGHAVDRRRGRLYVI